MMPCLVVEMFQLTGAVLEEHTACFDELFAQIRALILNPNTTQFVDYFFVIIDIVLYFDSV